MEGLESSLRKIASQAFNTEVLETEEISGGASHYTYAIKLENREEYVIKVSDYDWSGLPDHEHGFPLDGPVLRFLAEESIPTPRVVGFDNSGEDFDFKYLITEKVTGENMFEAWDSTDLSKVREAGRILARLHNSLSFESHGKLGWKEDGKKLYVEKELEWREMVEDMLHTFSENLEQTEFSEYSEELRELFEENQEVLRPDPPSVLLHQEFSPRNIMVSDREITGVIDWERAISGDPEYDLFIAERQFTAKNNLFKQSEQDAEEIRRVLRRGYKEFRGLEEGWQERRKIYQLIYITQVMWVLDDVVDSKDLLREYRQIRGELRK